MATLQDFPMMSQLSDIKEVNRQFDCVPTCIAASLTWLTRKSYDAAAIKDEVYGKNYVGGTAASAYVNYCTKQGVKLAPFNGIPGSLVSQIHHELEAQHPCIVTIPDPWAPSSRGWTHVLVAFSDEEIGTIDMLDPYPGKPYTKSDREWEQLLLNNQIWVMQKEDDIMPITITTPGVSNEFEEIDANHWKSKSTGFIIQYAVLAEFKARGYAIWGLPRSPEIPLGSQYVKQHYDNCVVGWKEGKVGLLPLYTGGPGTDPKVLEQQKNLAQLTAQLTLANQQLEQAKQQIDDLSHQPAPVTPAPDPMAEAALALVRGLKPQLEAF